MEFDLTAKKTEREWSDAFGRLASGLGEQLLKIVEWIIVVAALTVTEAKVGSPYVSGLKIAALIGLFLYLQGFFIRLDVKLFARPLNRWKHWAEVGVTAIASAFPLTFIWMVAQRAAAVIAASGAI